jgi:stage V sporulation protein SpoVS
LQWKPHTMRSIRCCIEGAPRAVAAPTLRRNRFAGSFSQTQSSLAAFEGVQAVSSTTGSKIKPSPLFEQVAAGSEVGGAPHTAGRKRHPSDCADDITISTSGLAGEVAAHLAHRLRAQQGSAAAVRVHFANARGILKALKVLAITHDFLSQHGSTLSFVPTACAEQTCDDPMDQNSGTQRAFTLEVWRRKCLAREVRASGVQSSISDS